MVWSVAQVHTNGGRDFSVTFDDANGNGTIDTGTEQRSVLLSVNAEIDHQSAGEHPTFSRTATNGVPHGPAVNEQAHLTLTGINWSRSGQATRLPAGLGTSRAVAEYLGWHRPPAPVQPAAVQPAQNNGANIVTPSEIPPILDRPAYIEIRNIDPGSRSRAQHIMFAIAQARSISRASLPGTESGTRPASPVGDSSLDELLMGIRPPTNTFPNEPRFNALTLNTEAEEGTGHLTITANTTTPYIFADDHGLTRDKMTQLVRWLERSSLPATSIPNGLAGTIRLYHPLPPGQTNTTIGLTSTSSLAIEFIQIHEDLEEAYRQYRQNSERLPTDSARVDSLVETYARVSANRLDPRQRIHGDALSNARYELLAYARIVETFTRLSTGHDALPQLGPTPENRRNRGVGGGGGGHTPSGSGSSGVNLTPGGAI